LLPCPSCTNFHTPQIKKQKKTVPVVRRTGGLADTVRDVSSGDSGAPAAGGSGYVFDGTDEGSLFGALDRALNDFRADPAAWADLAAANMRADVSWDKAASEYIALYANVAGVAL
jgi:starch synthase